MRKKSWPKVTFHSFPSREEGAEIGVFLHFQDDAVLGCTAILQNGWATNAVYRIVDDEQIKTQLGRFGEADCERLWHGSAYAEMHPELLALMERFELCYALRDSAPRRWLAPELLPPTRPSALAGRSESEGLALLYHYDFMPKGLISRLTVRLHRFVREPELAWHTGVLFEHSDSSVLVELRSNGSDIELRACGPEGKALLSVVAADLDALNDSSPGLQPEQRPTSHRLAPMLPAST